MNLETTIFILSMINISLWHPVISGIIYLIYLTLETKRNIVRFETKIFFTLTLVLSVWVIIEPRYYKEIVNKYQLIQPVSRSRGLIKEPVNDKALIRIFINEKQ